MLQQRAGRFADFLHAQWEFLQVRSRVEESDAPPVKQGPTHKA